MNIKQASTVHADRYAFNIYLHNGQKKPDLKRSFIRVFELNSYCSDTLVLDDGTAWTIYAEPRVIDSLREQYSAKCIISFQVFHDGEQIAVARLFREKQQHQQQDIKLGSISCQ